MKCCLCGNEIEIFGGWDQGNNAQPLKDGRCCNECNWTKVIPVRMQSVKKSSNVDKFKEQLKQLSE